MNIETANKLLQYRKASGLSQEELAEKIGVSRQAVSKWERAEASPDTDNLILLAKIYGVTLDELLMGDPTTTLNKEKEDNSQSTNTDGFNSSEENGNQQDKKESHVSFKNGIHINDGDDKVDISFKDGIHVESKDGTKVSVDKDGVNVVDEDGNVKAFTDENGHIHHENCTESSAHRKAKLFPFWAVAVAGFFAFGFINIFGGWATSWLWFLTIPMYYTAVDAIFKKKISHFAYPVFVVWLFCFFGMTCGLWHPLWLLFLTIPLYYYIAGLIDKKSENVEENVKENFTQDGYDVTVTPTKKELKVSTIITFIISAVFIVLLGTAGLVYLFSDTQTISKTYKLNDAYTDVIKLDNSSGTINYHLSDKDYSYIKYKCEYRGLVPGDTTRGLKITQENNSTEINHNIFTFIMGYFHEDIDIYLLDKDYELLYIDTASGDINLENLTCDKLEINSASGSTTGKYIQADNLNVDVSSGNVDIMGDFFNVGIDMASGDAKIDSGIMLDTLDIESSSGNVVVFLPEDKNGFTLNYSKASGEITSEFPLTGTLDSMDGSAVYAGGKYKYSIDIASGDVEFRKPI
ncbi:MAG: helix-turn-helix domain-containing protein [Ruminococcus sp.]|nr:helix-turn-helix domain-containing protein [Ruminococcus sp.]